MPRRFQLAPAKDDLESASMMSAIKCAPRIVPLKAPPLPMPVHHSRTRTSSDGGQGTPSTHAAGFSPSGATPRDGLGTPKRGAALSHLCRGGGGPGTPGRPGTPSSVASSTRPVVFSRTPGGRSVVQQREKKDPSTKPDHASDTANCDDDEDEVKMRTSTGTANVSASRAPGARKSQATVARSQKSGPSLEYCLR